MRRIRNVPASASAIPSRRMAAAPVGRLTAAPGPVFEKRTLGMMVIFLLWATTLFDPHWYLATIAPAVVLKLPILLLGCLILVLAFQMPSMPAWQRRFKWYEPYLLYTLVGVASLPFAMNRGAAMEWVQGQFLMWMMIVATVAIIGDAKRAETLVILYGIQFLWWALWGAHSGYVVWHHSLSNYDGFGAFNVGGVGICYFLGMGSKQRWFKLTMYGMAAVCAMGVVASFARGAFLALMLLFGMVWIRSPYKGRTFAAGIGALIVVAAAASFMFEDGFFVNEIMSAFHEGTEEGTGEDRILLWTAALRVFEHNPIIGSGPRNWGAVASTLFREGELSGQYSNPGSLYSMATHNAYITVLAEMGAIGAFAFGWMFVDFFRKNKVLRTPEAEQRWAAMGGRISLQQIALGLEASMIAFMANAAIYSMMGLHWFYTMVALNLLLHSVVTQHGPLAGLVQRAAGRARGGRPTPVMASVAPSLQSRPR